MTRRLFIASIIMLAVLGGLLYWIGEGSGRRRVIREMTDIATCPTCDGIGLVVTEEAPKTPEELQYRIVSPTNTVTDTITVTIPCCPGVHDNEDIVGRLRVSNINEITEFGRGSLIKTRKGEIIVTNTFVDLHRQLYGVGLVVQEEAE